MNTLLFNGTISGMKEMGAIFLRIDNSHMYFEIKKGSEIDNKEKLSNARRCIFNSFGLGLKIKRI